MLLMKQKSYVSVIKKVGNGSKVWVQVQHLNASHPGETFCSCVLTAYGQDGGETLSPTCKHLRVWAAFVDLFGFSLS